MCLPDSCCVTVKQASKQTGASVLILPNLYEWLHLLQPPLPTVQSRWMGICWPPTHQQLSAVFEVKQHPWLGAKSIFREVVVVVVIQGRGRRNQRQRDALRAGIHTDASLRCDQAERQRTSVERGQRSLPPHREPFLHVAPHFISLLHSEHTQPIISGSTSGEGGRGGERQPRSEEKLCVHVLHMHRPPMRKSQSVEIKRKSKPVDVRTGCFQRCVPQHQLAGCAVTGSC